MFLRIFQSLGFRLLMPLFLAIGAVLACYAAISFGTTEDHFLRLVRGDIQRTSEMIKLATHDAMLANRKDDVQATIARLAETPDIAAIRVYDKTGRIVMSARPEEIGRQLAADTETCRACHQDERTISKAAILQPGKHADEKRLPDVLRHLSAIENSAGCSASSCHAHPADKAVLGVLDLEMSTAPMTAALGTAKTHFFLATAVLTCVVLAVVAVFIRRGLQAPIARLSAGTRRIAQGDLDTRVEVSGHGELAELAKALNGMADDLSSARREVTQWSESLENKVAEKTLELQQAQRQVLHMEKMASLGKLSATVAHEINNPLSGMLVYAGLCRRELHEQPLDPAVREEVLRYLEVIERECRRCGGIVQNLLLFARQSGSAMAPVNVNEIVRQSLMLVEPRLQMNGVELQLRVAARRHLHRGRRRAVAAGPGSAAGQRRGGDERPAARLRQIDGPPPRRRRLGDHRSRRHRHGNPGRRFAADLRAVFFHEGRREGRRPGLVGRVRHRAAARRPDRGRFVRRRGNDLLPHVAEEANVTMPALATILIVDDEFSVRDSLQHWFRKDGYEVCAAADADEALATLEADAFDVALLDVRLPGMDGISLLSELRRRWPRTIVVMITAFASVDTAVQALKLGAADYVTKPINPEELSHVVAQSLAQRRLSEENARLRGAIDGMADGAEIVGQSPAMRKVLELVEHVAKTDATVMVLGESGTGKELVARAIHAGSRRRYAPLVAVNCGGIPDGLLESELFGHERGAFTGADAPRKGKLEMADGGTLFLDEVGAINPKMQVDLLRVLETHESHRLGADCATKVDFRVVCATNDDLLKAIQQGRFREDFYYRINVFTIELPPLRARRGDIPALARHFLDRLSRQMDSRITEISPEAMDLLTAHDWPGNVRELSNAIERAMVVGRPPAIVPADLPLRRGKRGKPAVRSLEDVERQHIADVLAAAGGSVTRAAEILQVDRNTVYNKIKKYGLRP